MWYDACVVPCTLPALLLWEDCCAAPGDQTVSSPLVLMATKPNQVAFEDLALDPSHWGLALEKVPRLQALKGLGLDGIGLNRAVPQVRRLSVR